MSRQDKHITDRHTKQLRELVKQPDNKLCADCKRNDPRWASWNIGVFLCIRCSGIHRGMGTHISRVKSVDLDVWTPEQMESINKWGNRRANLYWEAHLKPGHIPPDHKMESFIRSKYESRRWALEGPPPQDPSVLDDGTPPAPTPQTAQPPSINQTPRPTHVPGASISARRAGSPAVQNHITTRQPQPHQLLSAVVADRNQQARSVSAANPTTVTPQEPAKPLQKAPDNDLFSLDFYAPSPHSNNPPSSPSKKDTKQDILSLFSTPVPVGAPLPSAFGQFEAPLPGWGQTSVNPQAQAHSVSPISMVGTSGTGMWGVSSGWTGGVANSQQGNLWGNPTQSAAPSQQSGLFATSDVWNSSAGTNVGGTSNSFGAPSANPTQKKDDVFGDLWGGFK